MLRCQVPSTNFLEWPLTRFIILVKGLVCIASYLWKRTSPFSIMWPKCDSQEDPLYLTIEDEETSYFPIAWPACDKHGKVFGVLTAWSRWSTILGMISKKLQWSEFGVKQIMASERSTSALIRSSDEDDIEGSDAKGEFTYIYRLQHPILILFSQLWKKRSASFYLEWCISPSYLQKW